MSSASSAHNLRDENKKTKDEKNSTHEQELSSRTPLASSVRSDSFADRKVSLAGEFRGERKVYLLSFLLGIAALLPWFSFITSAPYFMSRFCGSSVESSFLVAFSLAYNLSNFVTQGLLLKFYQQLVSLERLRILGSLLLILIICILTTACVMLPEIPAMTLFLISIISIATCGALIACYTGSIMAVLGNFPGRITQAFVSGQGLAGCGVSIVSFVSIASGKEDDSFCDDDGGDDDECSDDVDYSAFAFFLTSCLVVMVSIACYLVLESLPSTKFFRDKAVRDRVNSVSYVENDNQIKSPLLLNQVGEFNELDVIEEASDEDDESEEESTEDESKVQAVASKYTRIYRRIKIPVWTVFCTFSVTLSLFPAITVLITSEKECDGSSRLANDLFIPMTFFIFNSFDFLGRFTARRFKPFITPSNMWIAAALRFSFFPLIMLCNIDGTELPVVFENDSFPIIFLILFGYSNGVLASLAMMAGPSLVPPRHSSLAATIMVFSLTLGLVCGAIFSFVTLYISQGSF